MKYKNQKLNGLKLFITGGAGFIGSHIVNLLANTTGVQITVYDNLSTGKLANLEKIRSKINFIKGDILNYKKLKDASKGFDVISHQAAQLELIKGNKDLSLDVNINLLGTINVARAAVENNIKKIINASSACVYGQNISGKPSNEKSPTDPNWGYGASKLAAEKYLNIFAEDYKLSVFNLRYSIVYGPGEWYGRVLTIFLKRVIQNLPLVVFGNGEQLRDFVYVEDVASVHKHLLESSLSGCHAFNISTGKATSINELASLVVHNISSNIKLIHEEIEEGAFSKIVKNRIRLPAELKIMWLDNKLAEKMVGWLPKVKLEEGLNEEFKWLKQHKDAWKEIRI